MTEQEEEKIYSDGRRSVWLELLRECLRNLDQPEQDKYGWIKEREAAIAVLRRICAEFGDNDWDEDLNLADIIDKHLGDHLFE